MADYVCTRSCMLQSNGYCLFTDGQHEHFQRYRLCALALRKETPMRKPKGKERGWVAIILEALKEYPYGITSNELAAMLHTSNDLIRAYMRSLSKTGSVVVMKISEKRRYGLAARRYFLPEYQPLNNIELCAIEK